MPPARQTLTDLDDDGQALLHQVVDFYHQNLLNSPDALQCLEKRGLNHPELVSHFKLGFAGAHGVAGVLPSPYSKEGKRLRSRLTALGVLRENTRQDHFRGCLVVPVTESREQTQAIHALQRHNQTLAGLLQSSEKQYLTRLHQNAQRLLRPLKVVNPYAEKLTFLSDKTRTRRDHMKYLTLIQSVALLHQYQREVRRVAHRGQWLEYIEVQPSDIRLANRIAHEVLGQTLDEMPPQTRKLLLLIQEMVQKMGGQQNCQPSEVRFTRWDIRAWTNWSDSQLKHHCIRLSEMEYLLLHGGSRGQLRYELLWDGGIGEESHLCGLLNVEDNKGG